MKRLIKEGSDDTVAFYWPPHELHVEPTVHFEFIAKSYINLECGRFKHIDKRRATLISINEIISREDHTKLVIGTIEKVPLSFAEEIPSASFTEFLAPYF